MRITLSFVAVVALLAGSQPAHAADPDFNGRWDLIVHKTPADKAWWLEVIGAGTPNLKGNFVGFPDGSLHDLPDLKLENGVLKFAWDRPAGVGRGQTTPSPAVHIDYAFRFVNGKLEGGMSGARENYKMTGERAPVINEHDDGTWIQGKPIQIFNGKDLTGWTGTMSDKAAGWAVENGILKSVGHADDLVTKEKYWNFELHAEFKLADRSNSGIGLRGRYEVQIASDYGREPGLHGTGALYTRIVPPVNAGKPPDQWQTYEIRLVGMEVTAALNGVKLYEKGVIDGLTGIAYDPYEGKPGSLELQGDHGPVEFRNLILTPLTQAKKAK
ncbi:MAG TPA: DUF1080 domain-containing protein [Bryobacteraceae bacterium]|nr:DUF1080 domain-containing protein [Bryobacteraceae bacterium]